jgi:hypothetical protein
MILRRPSLTGILCCTVLLSACGTGYDWSHAVTLNTIAGYRKFLSQYPDDAHAADAQSRIAKLQDEQAWTIAQIASTVAGYQQYLSTEPNGSHVPVAREEIATRERAAAWQTAQTKDTAQALQEFINQYPSTSEADQARDRLMVIAGYRAELGTARSERVADRERDTLAKRFGKDLHQVIVLQPDANDRDYRITSAPMSEHDADAACEALEHVGRACRVVQVAS